MEKTYRNMDKLSISVSFIFIMVFLITITSAIQVCETYDDFSSNNLDATKWIETTMTIDEHFIDGVEGAYHTAQLNPADREVTLRSLRNFIAGETFEYDVNYQSGSGNVLSRIIVNSMTGDTGLQTSECEGQRFATGGAVGFWNGLSCVGESINGLYHIKVSFFDNHVDTIFTDPKGNVISYEPIFSPTLSPYIVEIQTRTGHNGIVHIDYDNFVICREGKEFIRGDSNRDSVVDISDAIKILLYLFRGDELSCLDAADVNDDGSIDISDATYLLSYLFRGGPMPSLPYSEAGVDPTLDELICER